MEEAVLILCDRVKREAGTNKATLDGVFDQVATAVPGALAACLFVRCYGAADGPHQLTLLLRRPDGVVESLPPFAFPAAGGKIEGEVNLAPLPLPVAGRYQFVLSVDGTAVGSVSFMVLALAPPPPATPDDPSAN
ncbi:MAG: hypothetical protein JNK64_21170 [Myxococcales bacterium]|nr:hypothetical protein [Myxococcales bacterium]